MPYFASVTLRSSNTGTASVVYDQLLMEAVQQLHAAGPLSSEISVHPISRTDSTGAIICDIGARVEVLGRELGLSYQLPADHIAPIFSGTAWAGTMIWEAALSMCKYLIESSGDGGLRGRKVIELGAGIGLPGMVCALLGADVLLTEHEDLVQLLTRNLRDNFTDADSIRAATLDWEEERDLESVGQQDVIICCDCVYEPLYGQSWQRLIEVLHRLCTQNPAADVYISLERRTADGVDKFLAELDKYFETQVVREHAPIMIFSARWRQDTRP